MIRYFNKSNRNLPAQTKQYLSDGTVEFRAKLTH